MNDALRMYYHVNPLIINVKQPAGFDDFKPLVHQRRRIDRDFPPHFPVGMLEASLQCHAGKLICFTTSQRTTGSGQQQPANCRGLLACQTLGNRTVFTVNRNHRNPFLFGQLHHQRTGRDQRFLIGNGQSLSSVDAGYRRRQSGKPDQCIEDDVRPVKRRSRFQCRNSLSKLHLRRQILLCHFFCRLCISQHGEFRSESFDLLT